MGFFSWILLGLIAGGIAKRILPGKDPGGIFITLLIGIAGAFIGGFIASFLGMGGVNEFNISSVAIATGGSILLLLVYRKYKGSKSASKLPDSTVDGSLTKHIDKD